MRDLGRSQKKIAARDRTDGAFLARRYRRRYALGPDRVPTRMEALVDAACAEAEAEGAFAPDREEAVLSALYYALGRLAERAGVDMADVDRVAGDPYRTRPRLRHDAEQNAQEDEETRRGFAPILARAKAALKHCGGQHEIQTIGDALDGRAAGRAQ